MPWAAVACAAVSVISSRMACPLSVEPPMPEATDCASCGAPLSIYAVQCDYCKRMKEKSMFDWLRRTPKETPLQMQQRLSAERLRLLAAQQRIRHTPQASYSPSPAPAPTQSSFDPVSAALWYSVGTASHSTSPSPAPEPERFNSGGGGDFGGGGASNSWDSGSSCSSSSSDYSSSSSDSGSSSSCGSD